MYQSTSISYNGITSTAMGVMFCRIENQNHDEKFVSRRDPIVDSTKQTHKSKSRNYLYGVQRYPHQFRVELYCENMSDSKARELGRWFFQDKFCPFFSTDTNRIFYCMPMGEPKLAMYGDGSGYISFDMICKDEYAYSQLYTLSFDFSSSAIAQQITIENVGDVSIYPYMEIDVIQSNSTIKFTNLTNTGMLMTLGTDTQGSGLIANEHLEIDCTKEIITTDQNGLFRYSNLSGDFLELVRGTNNIQVEGKAKIKIICQYRFLM